MTDETREDGVKLGDIFKPVKRHVWVVLVTTVLAALIAVVLFHFAVNPLVSSYELDFRIQYPASDTQKYPDGAPFYYHDMVTEEYLQSAKESDEKFANINVAKIVKENDISIAAETETVNGVRTYTGRYTISVKSSYFKSKELAGDFIRAVASVPELRVKSAAAEADFTLDEDVFGRSSFTAKLDLLAAQKENVNAQYEIWNELFGGSYRIRIDGTSRTLFSYSSEAQSAFDEEENLRSQHERYNFQSDDVETERASLAAEYEANLRKINALKEAGTAKSYSAVAIASGAKVADSEGDVLVVFPEPELTVDQMLQKLIVRNADIETLLGAYTGSGFDGSGTLTTAYKDFVDELNRQYEELKSIAEKTKAVSTALYSQETFTRFDTQKVEETGAPSTVLVGVAALVIAFAVTWLAVWIYDLKKGKKGEPPKVKKNEPSEENASAEQ